MKKLRLTVAALAVLAAVVVAGTGSAQDSTGATIHVSVNSDGQPADDNSYWPSISADGRYVAFQSYATNIAAVGDEGQAYVFVHDRVTAETTLVSVGHDGSWANGGSSDPSISADGRYVAFHSAATNLLDDEDNGWDHVYVYDRETGSMERVSVSSTGEQGDSHSYRPSISADGTAVAFTSAAKNLVDGVESDLEDIYVHDRVTGETTRVSVASGGTEASDSSYNASISADGNLVAFYSWAENLVPDDGNDKSDVFVHDRKSGTTERVSVDSEGAEANGNSYDPSISGDGRLVAFTSAADNLVDGIDNLTDNIFVHDRETGETVRVSVSSEGEQSDEGSQDPAISGDGRFVAFRSYATNLVEGDDNDQTDVFVHDLETGATIRVSVATGGAQAEGGESTHPSINVNGRFVAFVSYAANLAAEEIDDEAHIYVHDLQGSGVLGLGLWGDVDCDGSVAIGDALKVARHLLGLSVSQTAPCPNVGSEAHLGDQTQAWGDADCDGSVAIGDALKTARHLLGLSVSQEKGCPEIDDEVLIAS